MMSSSLPSPSPPSAEKPQLYQLIIRQLMHEGLTKQAESIAQELKMDIDHSIAGDELENMLLGESSLSSSGMNAGLLDPEFALEATEIDLGNDEEEDDTQTSHEFPSYTNKFTSFHHEPSTATIFSPDGTLVASGSEDKSIKVLSVSKMYRHLQAKQDKHNVDAAEIKPVIRTFYDHNAPVTSFSFHPYETFLASASEDCTIKLFDHTRSGTGSRANYRSYRHIHDSHPINHIEFHPTGDYLLSATSHPIIRLYDIQTFQPYTARNPRHHHTGGVNMVTWTRDGGGYASCSDDGQIKLWDGKQNTCVSSIARAHSGVYTLLCAMYTYIYTCCHLLVI